MGFYRIAKTFEVEYGHRLCKHPEKCRFPHGHSLRIEVVARGREDLGAGRSRRECEHRQGEEGADDALSLAYREVNALEEILRDPAKPLPQVFEEVVSVLPPGWQYPDITCARIIYEGDMFKTEDFAVTHWQLASQIDVRNRKAGLIEVYYKEERPQEAEGPFMIEERLLLDEIALQISRTVGHILAREDLALLDDMSLDRRILQHRLADGHLLAVGKEQDLVNVLVLQNMNEQVLFGRFVGVIQVLLNGLCRG